MFTSIMVSHAGPEAAKYPHNITLLPPCLTVRMMLVEPRKPGGVMTAKPLLMGERLAVDWMFSLHLL